VFQLVPTHTNKLMSYTVESHVPKDNSEMELDVLTVSLMVVRFVLPRMNVLDASTQRMTCLTHRAI